MIVSSNTNYQEFTLTDVTFKKFTVTDEVWAQFALSDVTYAVLALSDIMLLNKLFFYNILDSVSVSDFVGTDLHKPAADSSYAYDLYAASITAVSKDYQAVADARKGRFTAGVEDLAGTTEAMRSGIESFPEDYVSTWGDSVGVLLGAKVADAVTTNESIRAGHTMNGRISNVAFANDAVRWDYLDSGTDDDAAPTDLITSRLRPGASSMMGSLALGTSVMGI